MAGWNPDGSYTGDDGQTRTLEDINRERVAKGLAPIAHDGSDGSSGAGQATGVTDLGNALDGTLLSGDPGAQLNTANADAERARLTPLLARLHGQAQTGDGAWRQQLAAGTANAQGAAQALGQSQPGVGMQLAQRNIGNAQAAAGQQAVGQGNLLRAKSQQDANNQLGTMLGGIQDQDISQSIASAGVNQGRREANAALDSKARTTTSNTVSGFGQAIPLVGGLFGAGAKAASGGYSEGGPVPGRPKVFGDSEKNDTVPAWLSPGEVVLPLSITSSPRAPEQAAAFVRALQNGAAGPAAGPQHFAGGGQAWQPGQEDKTAGSGLNFMGGTRQAPSIENGGLLDATQVDSMTQPYNALEAQLGAQAEGRGPSMARQQAQSGLDANIAAALQAGAGARGGGAAASGGNTLMLATSGAQDAAGHGAETAAGEQNAGQAAFGKAVMAQRARNMALAKAEQEAAWRNSMMNSGIGLEQQQQLRNVLAGTGSAMVQGASMGGGNKRPDYGVDAGLNNVPAYQEPNVLNTKPEGPGSSPDEFPMYAHGGQVDSFAAAYHKSRGLPSGAARMAEGGEMSTEPDVLASFAAPVAHSTPFGPNFTPGPIESIDPTIASVGPAVSIPRPAETAPAAAPAAPVAPVPPAPAAARAAPKVDEMGAAIKAEQKAAGDIAAANEQKANAEAQLYAAHAQDLAVRASHAADVAEQSHKASTEMLAKVQGARDEMANIDTTVDPGRFWASRSTGQKITNIIGLVLGAFGTGPDGINRAAALMQQAIDRDIDAQKAEHEFKLKKGQAAVDSATSMYGLNRQLTQDDIAADAAAHAAAWERTENGLKEATAKAAGPLAKANGAQAIAAAAAKKAEYDATLQSRAAELGLKVGALRVSEKNAESERIRANADAANAATKQAGSGFVAPGFELAPGAKPQPKELEDFRGALATRNALVKQSQALAGSITNDGTNMFGPKSAEASSMVNDLKSNLKELEKLGALSGSDYALLEAQIPDPTTLGAKTTSSDTMTARLGQLVKNIDNKFKTHTEALGIVAPKGFFEAPAAEAAPAQAETKTINGKTFTRKNGTWVTNG